MPDAPQNSTIRVRGAERPCIGQRHIRRRNYFLLEKVGSPLRKRFLAFDPLQGPRGCYFLVTELRVGQSTEQQLRVLARLTDESFPRIVEWQRRGEVVDVAITWTEGITVARYLEHIQSGRRPTPDPGQTLRLIQGLASSVCRLWHRLQVAHGDIQPENVIVTAHPSSLRLIDFGNAWTADRATTRVEGDGQHPLFAAPELLTSQSIDGFTADQFSVSVLFFVLLTGQIPYDGLGGKAGQPKYSSIAANALERPSDLSNACRKLPAELRNGIDAVVTRGLALSPELRFVNRHEWLSALSELSARFRLPPKPTGAGAMLTRVIERWFGTGNQ